VCFIPISSDLYNFLGYIQSSTPRSPTKSSSYNGGIRQTSLDNSWPTSPVKSLSDYSRHSSEHKNVGMRSTKSMQSLQRQGDKEPDLRNVSSMVGLRFAIIYGLSYYRNSDI
jgi:hypothetical protein